MSEENTPRFCLIIAPSPESAHGHEHAETRGAILQQDCQRRRVSELPHAKTCVHPDKRAEKRTRSPRDGLILARSDWQNTGGGRRSQAAERFSEGA